MSIALTSPPAYANAYLSPGSDRFMSRFVKTTTITRTAKGGTVF